MWINDPKLSLKRKLEMFDATAQEAVDFLFPGLGGDRKAALLEQARERHIDGHYVHGDGLLFEYDERRLEVERDEELADSVVYEARLRSLRAATRAVV